MFGGSFNCVYVLFLIFDRLMYLFVFFRYKVEFSIFFIFKLYNYIIYYFFDRMFGFLRFFKLIIFKVVVDWLCFFLMFVVFTW